MASYNSNYHQLRSSSLVKEDEITSPGVVRDVVQGWMTICRHLSPPTCWNRPLDHQHPSRLMYACLRWELYQSVHSYYRIVRPSLESFFENKKIGPYWRGKLCRFIWIFRCATWHCCGINRRTERFSIRESTARWLSSFLRRFPPCRYKENIVLFICSTTCRSEQMMKVLSASSYLSTWFLGKLSSLWSIAYISKFSFPLFLRNQSGAWRWWSLVIVGRKKVLDARTYISRQMVKASFFRSSTL